MFLRQQPQDCHIDVLHVTQPTSEGVAKVVLQLVADQSRAGLRVGIASPDNKVFQAALENLACAFYPWDATRSPIRRFFHEHRQLKELLQTANPRLVHLHSSKAGLIGRTVLRGRRPTVFEPNGWSFRVGSKVLRSMSYVFEAWAARFWTDKIICVSEAEVTACRWFSGPSKTVLVHNGVDLDRWSNTPTRNRQEARNALGIEHSRPIVLSLGRITQQKGSDLLVHLWKNVRTVIDDASLYFVGDGPDRARLQNLCSTEDAVFFPGSTTTPKLWFEAADVIAMPSRWEGHSLSMLEALACGRPVVAFDVEGMRETIGDDAGIVVPPGDCDAFTTALVQMLQLSHEDREFIGQIGRKKVEDKFNLEQSCAAIRSMYQQVLSKS